MRILTLVILLAAGSCRACYGSEGQSVGCERKEIEPNSVDAVLQRLKRTSEQLLSYQGRVEYLFSQPVLESQTLRKGSMYYTRTSNKSKLRINFETLKQDDEKEQKYAEQFIFDGIWLTHLDYQIKSAERRQLAEPNEPVDAFELAGRSLPIVGFAKIEELEKNFEITLVDPNTDNRETSQPMQQTAGELLHLHLKVRPDSAYKGDYTSIDFWVDKKLNLPAKVVAVSTEEDVYEIMLLKPMVNKEIDPKVFEFQIPKGFGEPRVIPLQKESSEN
jgi:outer membrane lipoprotein-sorting protein